MSMRTLCLAIGLTLAFAAYGLPARAEEGPGGGSVEEQIKQKLQEILRLMQENEQILLRASTGAGGKARRVDLDVPEASGKGGAGKGGDAGESGSPQGGDGSDGATKREELARKMRELIEGQRESGGKIPGEMGKLLKMIPSRPGGSGKGQGEPKDGKGEKDSEEEQAARDARKKLEQAKGEQDKPQDGDAAPQDPAKRVPKGGKPEDIDQDGSKRDDNVPAWFAGLPPEIRDAMAGGRAEDVPSRYRHLIERYHLWLQRNKR